MTNRMKIAIAVAASYAAMLLVSWDYVRPMLAQTFSLIISVVGL